MAQHMDIRIGSLGSGTANVHRPKGIAGAGVRRRRQESRGSRCVAAPGCAPHCRPVPGAGTGKSTPRAEQRPFQFRMRGEIALAASTLDPDDVDQRALLGGAPARQPSQRDHQRAPARPGEMLIRREVLERAQAEQMHGLAGARFQRTLAVRAPNKMCQTRTSKSEHIVGSRVAQRAVALELLLAIELVKCGLVRKFLVVPPIPLDVYSVVPRTT